MSKFEDATAEYAAHIHRAQSVIKFLIESDQRTSWVAGHVPVPDDTHMAGSKHMRVGVESAMASVEAVVGLLIQKGVITQEEYAVQLAHEMGARADSLEARARDQLPPGVSFG